MKDIKGLHTYRVFGFSAVRSVFLERSFQEEPYFSFEGIRPFRLHAGVCIPTVLLLNTARTCLPTGDRAPAISWPVMFGARAPRCRNVSFREAVYREIQSSCHKKDKRSVRPTCVCLFYCAPGRFKSIPARKTFKL